MKGNKKRESEKDLIFGDFLCDGFVVKVCGKHDGGIR